MRISPASQLCYSLPPPPLPLPHIATACKVHIFWEDHKILRNLHLTFDCMYVVKSKVKISQTFVAFSEYMNFTSLPCRRRRCCPPRSRSCPSPCLPTVEKFWKCLLFFQKIIIWCILHKTVANDPLYTEYTICTDKSTDIAVSIWA